MHRSLNMYFLVDIKKSQVHQNKGLRLFMIIVKNRNNDGEVEPRRNKRARIEKSFGLDFLTYVLEGEP